MGVLLLASAPPKYAHCVARIIILMSAIDRDAGVLKPPISSRAPGVYESFDIKGSMNTSSAGVSGGYVGAPSILSKPCADFEPQSRVPPIRRRRPRPCTPGLRFLTTRSTRREVVRATKA